MVRAEEGERQQGRLEENSQSRRAPERGDPEGGGDPDDRVARPDLHRGGWPPGHERQEEICRGAWTEMP